MSDIEFYGICDICEKQLELKYFNDNLVCDECSVIKNFENLKIYEYKTVLAIDVGIEHLAMTVSNVDSECNFKEVVWVKLINIMNFDCVKDCPLRHEKTVTDWISHVVWRYKDIFDNVDHILIERQPITGLVSVEQLLFCLCREKATLVHPSSVHSFFGMKGLDYQDRKKTAVMLTKSKLVNFQEIVSSCDREHDIADSLMLTLFWVRKEKERLEVIQLEKKRQEALRKFNDHVQMSLEDFFNMYRYIPNQPKGYQPC